MTSAGAAMAAMSIYSRAKPRPAVRLSAAGGDGASAMALTQKLAALLGECGVNVRPTQDALAFLADWLASAQFHRGQGSDGRGKGSSLPSGDHIPFTAMSAAKKESPAQINARLQLQVRRLGKDAGKSAGQVMAELSIFAKPKGGK